MKIVSCHIENFGRLHNYSIDLTNGINVICEENGWGKSTFAAFIRAMFYGLEGERKRSVEENERKRYRPWQGGVFGGQMIIDVEDKQYKVCRIFHEKEALDEFEIWDTKTNLPTKDYTKKLGEELFKIDRNSFMRTIFIGQNGCETAPTDDINAKIGNLTENSNDLNNYESANARLTEVINRLTPARSTGSIAKRNSEITRLESAVQAGNSISESIDTYQKYLQVELENYAQLKEQVKEAGKQQSEIAKSQKMIAKKTEWERLKKDVEHRQEMLVDAQTAFPLKVPSPEEMKKQLLTFNKMEKAAERTSLLEMTEKENQDLNALYSLFAQDIPKVSEIDKMITLNQKLCVLEQEYAVEQISEAEQKRFEVLKQTFEKDTESLSTITAKWNQRNAIKSALPSNQAVAEALKASIISFNQGKKTMSILKIVGVFLVFLAMLAVLVTKYKLVGLVFAISGVVLFIFGMMIGKNKTKQTCAVSAKFNQLQQTIVADSALIDRIDQDFTKYLSAHGKVFEESTVSSVLQDLAEEYMEYVNLNKKVQNATKHTKVIEIDSIQEQISHFLESYKMLSVETKFADNLYLLKDKLAQYENLQDKKQKYHEATISYQIIYDEILEFLERYGFLPEEALGEQLNVIREYVDAYQTALRLHQEAVCSLEDFEQETDIAKLKEGVLQENIVSLEELNQKIMDLSDRMEESYNKITEYNKEIEKFREQYDTWEESQVKLEEVRQIQELEQTKYDLVLKARNYLTLAKESITAKYADPILEGFRSYYTMITGDLAEKFQVDANISVTVDALGKSRETKTLSVGYRDLIGICLRIALVDTMYQEEVPLLLMDDPFTNLDDKKLCMGKKFLEQIAKKYQIIYLTCNNARSIERSVSR